MCCACAICVWRTINYVQTGAHKSQIWGGKKVCNTIGAFGECVCLYNFVFEHEILLIQSSQYVRVSSFLRFSSPLIPLSLPNKLLEVFISSFSFLFHSFVEEFSCPICVAAVYSLGHATKILCCMRISSSLVDGFLSFFFFCNHYESIFMENLNKLIAQSTTTSSSNIWSVS